MLAFEDPRAKKKKMKKRGGGSPDRFGAQADSYAANSYVMPETSMGADTEMARSVRSDHRGNSPRDVGIPGMRR